MATIFGQIKNLPVCQPSQLCRELVPLAQGGGNGHRKTVFQYPRHFAASTPSARTRVRLSKARGNRSNSSSISAPCSVRARTPATAPAFSSMTAVRSPCICSRPGSLQRSSKASAFDLARKKRADTPASETNPDVVNEVSCQNESVGEDATNVRRVDIGTCGRAASTAFSRPIVVQCSRRLVLHFPRTCSGAVRRCRGCPPTGQANRVFRRGRRCAAEPVPVFARGSMDLGNAVSVKNRVGFAWATRVARVRSSM